MEARKALYGEKKRDKDGNEVEREDVVLPDFSKIMNYINTQVKAPFICVVLFHLVVFTMNQIAVFSIHVHVIVSIQLFDRSSRGLPHKDSTL